MSRRRTPQRDSDDDAFPIRVKVALPWDQLRTELTCALAWLQDRIGPGDWADHPGQTLGGSTKAIYFRRIEDAGAFLEASPTLKRADGTKMQGNTSTVFPFRPSCS